MMVKALCCHTFARQNLFSPVAKATAITCAGSLAVVACDDSRIRVFDLNDPGVVLSEINCSGKVRSLAVSIEESFIVALESNSRSSPSSSRRTVRCYRNFLCSPFIPGPSRSAAQPPPALSPSHAYPEILEFSGFNSPGCLVLCSGPDPRLAVSAGQAVWLTTYLREQYHFRFDYSLKFDFTIHRLDLLGPLLAAASTEEVHLVRIRESAPPAEPDDAVTLPSLEKERREVGRSQRGLEVLGPTASLDVASISFSPSSHCSAFSPESLLFKRLPQSHTTKLHSVQLFPGKEPALLVASTFEGFSFRIGPTVTKSAHYAFTERTLKAKIGRDGLLHVITTCGLNTFTARVGRSDLYTVPERFPICLIGSLVWREIHMRTLEAWKEGLLLYTEKDNLHTLYSLRYQTCSDLFADMLQMARVYLADAPSTSYHLLCEAFRLLAQRSETVELENSVALIEFCLSAGCGLEDLGGILVGIDLSVEQVVQVCELLQKQGLEIRELLQSFALKDPKFKEKLKTADQEVVAMFYALLASCDKKLHLQSLLIRNDRNYLLAHEEVLLSLPIDDPQSLLLNCLFLFETSQLEEIESFVCQADEKSFLKVLKTYSHLIINPAANELSDFAQCLTIVHPRLLSRLVADLCDGAQLPSNLPTCCRALIEEDAFCRRPAEPLLPPMLARLLRNLTAGDSEGCPHRNLRCRQISSFLLDQRLSWLNSLPPFLGCSPGKVVHSAASNCRCCLCHSCLLRLQALLSWAVTSRADLSAIRSQIASADLPSLNFLLAHPDCVPRAFHILARFASHEVAEAYLRQEASRMDRQAWSELLASAGTNQKALTSSRTNQEALTSSRANQEAVTSSRANQEAVSSSRANQEALTSSRANQEALTSSRANQEALTSSRANQEAVTSSRALHLALELNKPHVAAQLAEAVSGGVEAVRPQLLTRYRSEIAGELFQGLMAGLENM